MAKQKLAIYQCPNVRFKGEGVKDVCGLSREKVLGKWRCRFCEPEVFSAIGVPPPQASTAPILPRLPNGTELMMERLGGT